MSFIVILICFCAQWFLTISSAAYLFTWEHHYSQWVMRQKFFTLSQGHGIFTVLVLVLPLLIAMSVLFTLVYHLLGHAGYLILSLVLLWYCTDVAILKNTAATPTAHADLLLRAYQKIFAPVLWYFVLGPIGLFLYAMVAALRAQLGTQYLIVTQGVLDWVPIRLLGLTFALAGNFSAVFAAWLQGLFQPMSDNQNQVIALGALAQDDAMPLLRRSLLIWLVIMVLITASQWIH
jgi:AmpE protein